MKSMWICEIKGYELCKDYKIYENGTVESYKKNEPTILKGSYNSKKYFRVSIAPKKSVKIHRLVALAFIPNPENKPQVNHINGIKTDNRVENLEWVTNSENQIHAYRMGLSHGQKGVKNYQFNSEHKNCRKVRQLTLEGVEIAVFNSIAMAGRSLNKGYGTISKCCHGECKYAYGFKWEFVNM